MNRRPGMHRAASVASLAVAVGISFVVLSGTARSAEAPALSAMRHIDGGTPKDLQMALALAAGPPVGAAATVYVLGPKGYEKAREGTNGFTCLVERQRTDTLEPVCYDVEGSATTLKARFYVEQERAMGRDEAGIASAIAEGYKNGRFIAPRKPGIVYMLSDYNYVLDPGTKQVIHFPGHLMFYAPGATAKDVGEGPGAPYLTAPGEPDNLMVVIPAASHPHQP
jgi:hypothetical protein